MIQLLTGYSQASCRLLDDARVSIDGIEVGPYLTVSQARQARERFPSVPFYFHGARTRIAGRTLAASMQIWRDYVAVTGSPCVSFHIALVSTTRLRLALGLGWYLPQPKPNGAMNQLCNDVAEAVRAFKLPVLLENMPTPPRKPPPFACEIVPEAIAEVLETTGCGLLLDLAHARVAAAMLDRPVREYLAELPLERVAEIHVSGPREFRGYWVDAHEPMGDDDYALLEWTLARSHPQTVMLEYFRDSDALCEQLTRLRRML